MDGPPKSVIPVTIITAPSVTIITALIGRPLSLLPWWENASCQKHGDI
jgi:hypothetical protein